MTRPRSRQVGVTWGHHSRCPRGHCPPEDEQRLQEGAGDQGPDSPHDGRPLSTGRLPVETVPLRSGQPGCGPGSTFQRGPGGPMALQRWGPWGPTTLQRWGSWGPTTLQRQRTWGPATLQRWGSWGPATLQRQGSWGPATLQRHGSWGPGVPVCTGVRTVCPAPCFQLPRGPLLCWCGRVRGEWIFF